MKYEHNHKYFEFRDWKGNYVGKHRLKKDRYQTVVEFLRPFFSNRKEAEAWLSRDSVYNKTWRNKTPGSLHGSEVCRFSMPKTGDIISVISYATKEEQPREKEPVSLANEGDLFEQLLDFNIEHMKFLKRLYKQRKKSEA